MESGRGGKVEGRESGEESGGGGRVKGVGGWRGEVEKEGE